VRKLIISTCLVGSFVIFAAVINLYDAMFMFLLFGILPGRDEQLSANQMLVLYSTAGILLTTRLLPSQIERIRQSIKDKKIVIPLLQRKTSVS
jgi:hypothetical protein